MLRPSIVKEETVRSEWVDYNGHMNDAAYVQVFSTTVDKFLIDLGLDSSMRTKHSFSVYTLENHMCYLRECHQGDLVHTTAQIVDYDAKRIHLFLVMYNETGTRVATSEQMLIGVSTESGRAAPFPAVFAGNLSARAEEDSKLGSPDGIGQSIGIPQAR